MARGEFRHTTLMPGEVAGHSMRGATLQDMPAHGALKPAPCRFTPDVVACSDCDVLEATTHDADLVAECKACCVKGSSAKYVSATLEVCPHRLT